MARTLYFSLCTVSILLAAGCATRGIETSARITADSYKSEGRKHRSDIEVFETGAPSGPYYEVATIRAVGIDKSTRDGLIEAMQIRAAKVGADALTDFRFFSEPVTGGPTGSMHCPTWKECRYLGGDSYITSRPAAEASAVVYGESPGPEIPEKPGVEKPIHMPEEADEMMESEGPGTSE